MTSVPRLPTTWSSRGRADLVLSTLLVVMGVYTLALWPLTPALIGSHPLLLEVRQWRIFDRAVDHLG